MVPDTERTLSGVGEDNKMTLEQFIAAYGGWIGFVLFFLYTKLWPLVADKIIPTRLKRVNDEQAAKLKQIEAEQAATIKRATDDQEFMHRIVESQLATAAKIADAVQNMALNMSQTNERMVAIKDTQTQILDRQNATLDILNDAIMDMRAHTGASTHTGLNRRKGDPHVPNTDPKL